MMELGKNVSILVKSSSTSDLLHINPALHEHYFIFPSMKIWRAAVIPVRNHYEANRVR